MNLLLAVFSSAMISIIMRLSSDKVQANRSMLAINYLVCAILGAIYVKFQVFPLNQARFGTTIGLGVVTGVLFLAGFILLQINTNKNGVVLSSIFMKLGLLVPILLSIVLFGEMPTSVQWIGFAIAVVAIIGINYQKNAGESKFSFGLLFLLIVGGTADVMAKMFEHYGQAEQSNVFLFYTFIVAFLLCVGLVISRKERPGRAELIYGAMIGIPNFFTSKFLIAALGEVPAVIAYPTYSVGTILIVTLAGVVMFKETLSKRQWIALGAILIALVLLNI